jgi:hypothetical protein
MTSAFAVYRSVQPYRGLAWAERDRHLDTERRQRVGNGVDDGGGEAIARPSHSLDAQSHSVPFPDPSHLGDHVTDAAAQLTNSVARNRSGVPEEEPTMRETATIASSMHPHRTARVFHAEKHCLDSFRCTT